MKRILLVQPSLQPPGGGSGVASWILQALKDEHTLSVLSTQPVDVGPINRAWGTTLAASDVHQCSPSFPFHRPLRALLPLPLALLEVCLLLRVCKQFSANYDLVISAYNEGDFGRRGIQYVHFPLGYLPRPDCDLRWYHLSPALVRVYNRVCLRIAGFSFDRVRGNVTLVNSDWTGAKVRERYGIDSTTLYPPVGGHFPDVPWADRENGFLCVGRIAPEKEIEKVIDIVGAVRAQGQDVHLHIIGTADRSASYYRRIRRRVQAHPDWILMNLDLSRTELTQLVARHRYGIHGMTEEHFGMAVAEMASAGCIVFVPNGGGQVEIVDSEARLLYRTDDEAVANIADVLGNSDLQTALRAQLAARRERFSAEQFVEGIRAVVRNF